MPFYRVLQGYISRVTYFFEEAIGFQRKIKGVEKKRVSSRGRIVAGLKTEFFVIRFQFLASLILILHVVALGEQIARLHHVKDGLPPVLGSFVKDSQIEMGLGGPGTQFQGLLKRLDGLGMLTPLFVFRSQLKIALRVLRFAPYFLLALPEFA